MIKVYLDWNVMSGLKNDYFPELMKILGNKDKFLLIYSTAHIGDLIASAKQNDPEQDSRIDQDLAFISELTDNRCMAIYGKDVSIQSLQPRESYKDQKDSMQLLHTFSLDTILENVNDTLENDAITKAIKPLFELYKNMQLPPEMTEALNNDVNNDFTKMFPGLRENPTMGGFFDGISAMWKNLNETTAYKDLRDMVQKIGVNSGHFNDGKNPFELIESAYAKTQVDPRQHLETGKNAPVWYDEIVNEYLLLDMHGYKADKVKVTEREKNTFKNTTEDAFHSAFASRCEFYITNDDRNYQKTRAIYDKKEITTGVFKPSAFLDYYNEFLDRHTFAEHFQDASAIIKNPEGWEPSYWEDGSHFGFTRFCNEYFFNFFNKITLPSGDNPYFLFTKTHTADTYIITPGELNGVIRFLLEALGDDVEMKGELVPGEVGEEWSGRTWETEFGKVVFRRLNTWFQLYFYLNTLEEDNETKHKS